MKKLGLRMNSETHPCTLRHINYLICLCYTINHTLSGKGELNYESGAISLLNVASCPLNGTSCLRASFLLGELPRGQLSLGRVVRNPNFYCI